MTTPAALAPDSTVSAPLQKAVLGGGCFWCLEAVYNEVVGVHAVQSGYAGGTVAAPDYEAVCSGSTGHAEVVRVLFDPAVIDYRGILEIFFVIHDPTTLDRQGHDVGTQYRSVIFADEAQQAVARALVEELTREQVFDAPIVTRIEPPTQFWPAEDVHERYYERHPGARYCALVIAPKLEKFRHRFAARRRPAG